MIESQSFSSKDAVIRSFERFLHYTCRCNRESIEHRGLRPDFMAPGMAADLDEPNALRYCIPSHKVMTLQMVRNKYWVVCECNPKIIEVHVPANVMATLRYGLDRSSSTTVSAMARLGKTSEDQLTPEEYHRIIVETGYVSCYDPVPPGTFAIVEL